MLAGASLAASGTLLQAVMKNPVADPGIIGISAGAGFFSVVVTALFPSLYFMTPLFAILGGVVSFAIVYSLAWSSGLNPVRIILVGIAVGFVFSGLSEALNSFSGGNLSGVASVVNGNITMKTWSDVRLLAAYSLVFLVISTFTARHCNLLALDDKAVRSLGVNADRSRIVISLIAVALASASAAVVGVISFLGLCAPHIARLLIGSNHRTLIPFSMLIGAFLLLLVDTLGRTIAAPYEISAGILMAVFGGPCFIVLLKKWGKGYGNQ
jgi:iron complex transport system permease protein